MVDIVIRDLTEKEVYSLRMLKLQTGAKDWHELILLLLKTHTTKTVG